MAGARNTAKFISNKRGGAGSALGRLRRLLSGRGKDSTVKKLLRGESGLTPSEGEVKPKRVRK